jgi:hypothetical protein
MRPLNLPDRIVLEQIIIPAMDYGNVCFVGTDKHTDHYPILFTKSSLFILNKDENRAMEGKQNLIGTLQEIDSLAGHDFFDVIIANGLAGFGTDSETDVRLCFDASYNSLKVGGIFIWGWCDTDQRRVVDPMLFDHKFSPYFFSPLDTWRYPAVRAYNIEIEYRWSLQKIIDQNHTFDFYKK